MQSLRGIQKCRCFTLVPIDVGVTIFTPNEAIPSGLESAFPRWIPDFPSNPPAQHWSLWDEAFPDGTGILTEYPDELKEHCFQGDEDGAAFNFRVVFQNSSNCGGPNPHNQEFRARYRLHVCNPVHLHAEVIGRVEKVDTHFDFLIVRYQRVLPLGGELQTLIYVHGTGEGTEDGCDMADITCCKDSEDPLDPGTYLLDIQIATGDGLWHQGAFWDLGLSIKCDQAPVCTNVCEQDEDPPWEPPPPDDDPRDDEFEPPYGLPPPGPEEPPTPGYRGDCTCENCVLIGMAVEFSGLPSGSCTQEPSVPTTGCTAENVWQTMLDAIPNTVLSDNGSGGYELLLGSHGDADDMGVLVESIIGTWEDSNDPPNPLCGPMVSPPAGGCITGTGGTALERETYCWKISGTISCELCETTINDVSVVGVQWTATVTLHFHWRQRWPTSENEGACPTDWTWGGNGGDCVGSTYTFSTIIENPCTVPPGCNGYVLLQGAMSAVEQAAGCPCTNTQLVDVTVTPIGTTTLCVPIEA